MCDIVLGQSCRHQKMPPRLGKSQKMQKKWSKILYILLHVVVLRYVFDVTNTALQINLLGWVQ